MNITTMVLGPVQTNCYITQNSGQALIIDPADRADLIIKKCEELKINLIAILLTHGHFDHIGAVNDLKEAYKIPVYAGRDEEKLLSDTMLNGSAKMNRIPIKTSADILVDDNEILEIAGLSVKVIATPGHTSGCVCYYIESEKVLFSGDTLFADSFGRTDFPTGSQSMLKNSIINKLFVLPDDTAVYPGHDRGTVIEYEKVNNPIKHF